MIRARFLFLLLASSARLRSVRERAILTSGAREMDSRSIAETYQRDGFIILPNLLTVEEAQEIKKEITRVLKEVSEEARSRGENPDGAVAGGVYVGLSARSEKMRAL